MAETLVAERETDKAALPALVGDTVESVTKNMERDDAVYQRAMSNNPLFGFFYMMLRMMELFGGEKLLESASNEGSFLNKFVSNTFGFEKSGNMIAGLTGHGPKIGKIEVGERQNAVNSVLNDAAASAGVHPDMVKGIWGIESAFGTHKTLVSGSGCSGDFQFCEGTFNDVFSKESFRDRLLDEQGDKLEPEVKQALETGNWKVSTKWGSDLRFHPIVSTYAAADYMSTVAKTAGVDPMNKSNMGVIYAGYNVGPGNADKLVDLKNSGSNANAGAVLGSAASWNPAFFVGGASADVALGRYQNYVEKSIGSWNQNFGNDLSVSQNADVKASAERTASASSDPNRPRVLTASFDAAGKAVDPIEKETGPEAEVVQDKVAHLKSTFTGEADPSTKEVDLSQIVPDEMQIAHASTVPTQQLRQLGA